MAVHGACRSHPFLGPDDWFEISYGKPQRKGAEAILVCRFSCHLRDRCPIEPAPFMISGGGWSDGRGNYRAHDPEIMEMHQAAAYIGMAVNKLQDLVTKLKLERPEPHGWLYFKDVEALAEKHSPAHGTMSMWRLHQLRGERPCPECIAANHLHSTRSK